VKKGSLVESDEAAAARDLVQEELDADDRLQSEQKQSGRLERLVAIGTSLPVLFNDTFLSPKLGSVADDVSFAARVRAVLKSAATACTFNLNLGTAFFGKFVT
jgi:hypothetical protein